MPAMQTEQTYTITLTEAERKAVISWADASGQGFHYGLAPEGWDQQPAQTARKKLDEAKPDASTTDKLAEWLREKPDHRSATAEAHAENYDGIGLTLHEEGQPDRYGVGWDLNMAFDRAQEGRPDA